MAPRDRKPKPLLKDWHLWSDVARSVTPIRPAKKRPEPEGDAHGSTELPAAVKSRRDVPGFNSPAWSPRATQNPTPPGRVIEPRMRRRLERGQLPIDATIDLHGMRQNEAHAALTRFLAAAAGRGDRTVLVITGKGIKKSEGGDIVQKGVLRAMLPIWLADPRLSPLIAGWEPSARIHGGEGAYYIRLRRLK